MKSFSLFFRVCVSSHLGLFSSTGSSAAIAKLWTNMTFVQMMMLGLAMIFKLMTMWAFWWHLERQMTIMMNVSKAFWQTTQWITFLTLKKGISVSLSAGRMDWILKQNLRRCKKKYLCRTSSVCHMSLTQNAVKAINWGKKTFEVHSVAAKYENASFRWWRKMAPNKWKSREGVKNVKKDSSY